MWVRFWVNSRSYAPILDVECDVIKWVSDRETDSSLKEWARELVPSHWCQDLTYCGYEILDPLPETCRNKLIRDFKNQIESAKEMLEVLEKS